MIGRTIQGNGPFIIRLASAIFWFGSHAWADDVVTLSGRTLHQVQAVRVEPDGIIWAHATGMCKVDFTDLPDAVRVRYHYNAKQAAAYQAARERAQRQAAEQARQDQRREALRAEQTRRRAGESFVEMERGADTFVFHRERSIQKAEEAVGEQVATRKVASEKLTEYDGTIYDRRLWKIPQLLTGMSSDAHGFDAPDVNSPEYRRSLLRPPADQSYYQDVDRAEAFARGKP